MPDNIYTGHFAYRGEPAWHSLGNPITDPTANATEVVKQHGFDYEVYCQPLRFTAPSGREVLTDRVAIVRGAKGEHEETTFGYATDTYKPIQNLELARLLDPLTKYWPVHTIGALGQGETVFMTLDAGLAKVGGDDIQQYFFAYNGHDGSTSLKINVTPVRVVCANTCALGLSRSTITAEVRHTQTVLQEAEFAISLVAQLRVHRERAIEGLDALTRIRVSADQIKRVLENVYPDVTAPSKLGQLEAQRRGEIDLPDEVIAKLGGIESDTEAERTRALKLRLGAFETLMAFNQERPNYAMTAWAVYCAVTAMASHRSGGTDAQIAKSLLMGTRQREITTAYKQLVKLA